MKRKNKKTLKIESLSSMLKEVNLGGVIEECILEIVSGKGHIEAVDMTNNLIVISTATVSKSNLNATLGLGNLELLIKFLSTISSEKIHFEINKLALSIYRKDRRRRLEYLLTEPDLIATRLVDEEGKKLNTYKKLKKMVRCSVELTPSFLKDFLSYISMLKSKEVAININGEEMKAVLGGIDDHQFTLVLGNSVESEEEENFVVKINGEHMSKIFSIIDYDEDDPPVMKMADGKPIVVENGKTAWALVPLMDIEATAEEEEDDEDE